MLLARALVLLAAFAAPATALLLPVAAPPRANAAAAAAARARPRMGWFDSAFANEDLGPRQNAGLSKEKAKKTITWKGPSGATKKSVFVPGQQLKQIARGAGIPIKYDCQEGTCKTCEAKLNGGVVKICVAKAPAKDCTIQYGLRQQARRR